MTVRHPKFHIVLYQPEIPQNTGNIGRTCVALNAKLWLVRPCGFRLDETRLRRAGLDYWEHLDWEAVDHWEALEQRLPLDQAWYLTKHSSRRYTSVSFRQGDVLIFGSESRGLPEAIREQHRDRTLGIPMPGTVRSLNLSVAVGIVAYEAFRQVDPGSDVS
jgi:tRNA (cytidine/uridine-2'-O-)-methyltransferase